MAELHYITPLANLLSILQHGILSHKLVAKLPHSSIASQAVQSIRASKVVPRGRPLHDYANLYIDARNPMMYVRQGEHLRICVLRVSTDVLDLQGAIIADGNAADHMTLFSPSPGGLASIEREKVFAVWWTDSDRDVYCEKKRARCAEVLIPDRVLPSFILGAYVSCASSLASVNQLNLTKPLPSVILERMFFR